MDNQGTYLPRARFQMSIDEKHEAPLRNYIENEGESVTFAI